MNENTLNLAVAMGANIEYRADGTILIKPKGFEVKAMQTQPQEWREPQSPPVGVGRLMLTYLKGSGDLVVARYSTTPRAVYAEMIKVLKGKPYDADIIDAIFSTAI